MSVLIPSVNKYTLFRPVMENRLNKRLFDQRSPIAENDGLIQMWYIVW